MLKGGRARLRRLIVDGCEDRVRRVWVGDGGAVREGVVRSASVSSVLVEVTFDMFDFGMMERSAESRFLDGGTNF